MPEKLRVTVDVVLFTVKDAKLNVLLVERAYPPFEGWFALPGGHVEPHEDLAVAAYRELQEEAFEGTSPNVFLEQLYTFGAPHRDPRGHYVSIAYLGLAPLSVLNLVQPGSDAKRAFLQPVEDFGTVAFELGGLAFDHSAIVKLALERLRGKIDYTALAANLLEGTFTLEELRRVYEIIKGDTYNARTFRRKFRRMVDDKVFEVASGFRETGGRHAALYRVPERAQEEL